MPLRNSQAVAKHIQNDVGINWFVAQATVGALVMAALAKFALVTHRDPCYTGLGVEAEPGGVLYLQSFLGRSLKPAA